MLNLDCEGKTFQDICKQIRECNDVDVEVTHCLGHRYIGSGVSGKKIKIYGTPGNALGSYMDGATIEVFGSAQDAVGDTMNEGEIVVHGNSGDATGYAMRGGKIFIQGNAGYRAGIHMKAYKEKFPVLVIGGKAGSFLGEYQAGGVIIVLGIGCDDNKIVGYYTGNGMHGGKIILRTDVVPELPTQIVAHIATAEDLKEIDGYVAEYCRHFETDKNEIMSKQFVILQADSNNPYKRLYVNN